MKLKDRIDFVALCCQNIIGDPIGGLKSLSMTITFLSPANQQVDISV